MAVALAFVAASVFLRALTRSGDLRIEPADLNFSASASLGGMLLVAQKLMANAPTPAHWRLGIFAALALLSLLASGYATRALDQISCQGPSTHLTPAKANFWLVVANIFGFTTLAVGLVFR